MKNSFYLQNLPSRYVPYPPETEISIRPLITDEVAFLSEHRERPIEVVDMFTKEGIVTGVTADQLTLGDYLYCLFTVLAASYSRVIYTLSDECDECKLAINSFSMGIKDIPGSLVEDKVSEEDQKEHDLLATIPVGEIEMKFLTEDSDTLDPKTNCPIVIQLNQGGEVGVDFYRILHYRQVLKKQQEMKTAEKKFPRLQEEIYELSLRTGVDVGKLGTEDYAMVKLGTEMLDHGPIGVAKTRCSNGHEKTLAFDWRRMQTIPFRQDRGDPKQRIRFGKGLASVSVGAKTDGPQRVRTSIPTVSRISQESPQATQAQVTTTDSLPKEATPVSPEVAAIRRGS